MPSQAPPQDNRKEVLENVQEQFRNNYRKFLHKNQTQGPDQEVGLAPRN